MHIYVDHCFRCGNELTWREKKAKQENCEPCRKVKADNEYRERLGETLADANKRASR